MDVMEQEAVAPDADGLDGHVPEFMTEIVAEMSQQARRSPHVNQRSGVSVRLSIANYETLVANALRRSLRNGESEVVPRVSDLDALVASTAGKIEIETVDEGRDERVLEHIVKASVLEVFRARVRPEMLGDLVTGVRRRARRPHRRRAAGRPTTPTSSARCPGSARCSPSSTWARRRPGSPRRSSSCSRASTCRSGSTRTPSTAAPRTALAASGAAHPGAGRRRSSRFAIAVEEPEGHLEAVAPLVVVDAGPVEEPADVDAVGDRLLDDAERLAQHVDAPVVVGRCPRRARRSTAAGPGARPGAVAARSRAPRSRARTPSARPERPTGTGDLAVGADRGGAVVREPDEIAALAQVGDLTFGRSREREDAVAVGAESRSAR